MKKFCFFILSASLFCCSGNNNKIQMQYEQIEKIIGTKIIFPDSVQFIDLISRKVSNDTLFEKNSKIKITTNIDGTCHACVGQLKLWTDFIDNHKEHLIGVSFLFFVQIYDYSIFEFLVKDVYFPYPIIYDSKDEYIVKNKLPFYNTDYQTFLLNEKNEIYLVGNPIYNRKLADLYIQEIKKMKHRNIIF